MQAEMEVLSDSIRGLYIKKKEQEKETLPTIHWCCVRNPHMCIVLINGLVILISLS